MDHSKIASIVEWPVPDSVKTLRGFLGISGYYRRFIRNYGVITKPLTELLKKDGFKWDDQATEAFKKLKAALCEAPVLAMPNFSIPFVVETDASATGMGAVLMQQGKPISYLSKAFNKKNMGFSVYEKELLALVLAVTKWRHYLVGHHFIIKTDHQSLKYLLEQPLHTSLQYKWLSKLLGLDYEIQYKKGVENSAADALSRVVHQEPVNREESIVRMAAISEVQPVWLQQVLNSYEGDETCQGIISQLLLDSESNKEFQIVQGILKKGNKIYLGSSGEVRKQVISALHNSSLGGHSGQNACLQRIKTVFYWPGMKQDVVEWIRTCEVCQKYKSEHNSYPGLLQPLPIPTAVWKDISMDFVEKLPDSEGANAVLVVVDRLSKYGHFIALSHPFNAEEIANIFLDQVFRLHGLPTTIVSDRDKIFTSKFWSSVFEKLGVQLNFTSAYHPQSDGQTERLNQCLEAYLRCFAGDRPCTWKKWLGMAEYWYNTSFHTSLGLTPYEALYGTKPITFSLGNLQDMIIPVAENCWFRGSKC